MKKGKALARKITATVLAIAVMLYMLYFAYEMLLAEPVFEGVLQIILIACVGALSLATLYFFFCKIYEIITLIRTPKKEKQNTASKPE